MKLNLTKEYENNRGLLISLLHKHCGDYELSRDTYSELFFKVAKRDSESFDSINGFTTWLFVVGRNMIRDYYRSKYHRTISYIEDWSECVTETEPNFEDKVVKEDVVRRSKLVLDKLPLNQRSAFKRAIMYPEGVKNIAKDDGVSINTVVGRVRYAKRNLKKLYHGV